MAVLAAVDRWDVEEDDEEGKQSDGREQADDDRDDPALPTDQVECDVRKEGEGEEESETEADEMSVVVDPGKQSDSEEG